MNMAVFSPPAHPTNAHHVGVPRRGRQNVGNIFLEQTTSVSSKKGVFVDFALVKGKNRKKSEKIRKNRKNPKFFDFSCFFLSSLNFSWHSFSMHLVVCTDCFRLEHFMGKSHQNHEKNRKKSKKIRKFKFPFFCSLPPQHIRRHPRNTEIAVLGK